MFYRYSTNKNRFIAQRSPSNVWDISAVNFRSVWFGDELPLLRPLLPPLLLFAFLFITSSSGLCLKSLVRGVWIWKGEGEVVFPIYDHPKRIGTELEVSCNCTLPIRLLPDPLLNRPS